MSADVGFTAHGARGASSPTVPSHLLESSSLQVGESRISHALAEESSNHSKRAAANSATRMIRSETPLGVSRARVSVHCQALRPLGFTSHTDRVLGVAV